MRITLRHIIMIGLLAAISQAHAQQTPQWTQYILNKYAINPAYGGLERSLSVTTGIRSQWNQFPGAPKTQAINAHLPLYFLNGSVGMGLINDESGALKRTVVSLSYNYVYDASWGLLSVGVRGGAQQVNLDGTQLITPDGIYVDQTFDHQDPLLPTTNIAGYTPQWALGVYYMYEGVEAGITLDNVPNSNLDAGGTLFSSAASMTLFASYQYGLTEQFSIVPNLLLKTESGQTQLEIGALAYYNQLFGGLSFRGYSQNSLDAMGIIAGTQLSKKVRISYSFDIGLGGFADLHDGSHEFIINYNLQRPIRTGELPKIIHNPRYR